MILLFWRIAAASGLMNMAKRDGESGHPCLVPWCKVKLGEVIPLVVIVALGEVYSVVIHWMNDSPNSNLRRMVNTNVQLTLSNAFSASSDAIMF